MHLIRSVVEHLDALGWKIMFMGGSGDELEKAAQNQAQELGYPVTNEACAVGVNLELQKDATSMTPEMIALLRRLPTQSQRATICARRRMLFAVITGEAFIYTLKMLPQRLGFTSTLFRGCSFASQQEQSFALLSMTRATEK
ncbi:hypothetical protein BDP27DRAFT_1372332 [Rhodocollybia butyracea]|uniref:Uncharacterized protein n=1 Tax=Rhodocollybia butyracea TaxID=206335 RepID=A0A9P5P5K0_9AGAR|nr:hypothetical protein BDP27DRAFT_1372332 [Rhodocollybia butyracea]